MSAKLLRLLTIGWKIKTLISTMDFSMIIDEGFRFG